MIFKGIVYQSPVAYRIIEWFKVVSIMLTTGRVVTPSTRMLLAAKHVQSGDSVIELCCGLCDLVNYLPKECSYLGVDSSDGFEAHARNRSISYMKCNLAKYPNLPMADSMIMIISLYQFRHHERELLLYLQRYANRIIIVEDTFSVAIQKKTSSSLLNKFYGYLVESNSISGHQILASDEVTTILNDVKFQSIYNVENYVVGVWDRN